MATAAFNTARVRPGTLGHLREPEESEQILTLDGVKHPTKPIQTSSSVSFCSNRQRSRHRWPSWAIKARQNLLKPAAPAAGGQAGQ